MFLFLYFIIKHCFYGGINFKPINVIVEEYTKIESFLKQTSNWEVEVCILAEPCIEWRDTIPRKIIQDMGKKYNNGGTWTVSTSECYSGSFVKPGGSLIYSTGSTVGKMMERGSDPWGYGRWTYVRYQGKAGKSLLVIGAYRVGRRTGNPGPTTAWFQQKVLLTKDGREELPEEAFLRDLET